MAKTADVAPDVNISDLFPTLGLPSKWHGWRRILRPFPILGPRNTLHYTCKSRLALVRNRWSGLTDQQRADWSTWAAANPPDDGIWQTPFLWTGQLAHAFSNMRLLFIGRAFRDDAPDVTLDVAPALDEYVWVPGPPPYIHIKWLDPADPAITTLVSIRFFSRPSGLKTWLYLIPFAYLEQGDRTYRLQNPPGVRMWFALQELHNIQGVASPPMVYWIDRWDI